MNIKEINSRNFKKALPVDRALFRYHNKNKNGGNFGFELREIMGRNLELWGHYGIDGTLHHLQLMELFSTRYKGICVKNKTIEELFAFILSICGDVKEE